MPLFFLFFSLLFSLASFGQGPDTQVAADESIAPDLAVEVQEQTAPIDQNAENSEKTTEASTASASSTATMRMARMARSRPSAPRSAPGSTCSRSAGKDHGPSTLQSSLQNQVNHDSGPE